jgi:primosomal protein N''
LQSPPPLCDFEQWIDTEIKEEDKEYLRRMKQWDAERKELLEKTREEVERRHAAERREEREQKLERARRAKAVMEENLDALRKRKWPRCTQ